LEELGYAIALFPVTTLRIAMGAVERALAELARTGTQAGFIDEMQTRARLYELIEYDGYEERDQSYFGDAD
jgi:methylisocitrate lyase